MAVLLVHRLMDHLKREVIMNVYALQVLFTSTIYLWQRLKTVFEYLNR